MRKKYLSALLFGALVMASTATFTSCKDYDDDIDNLQTQIDKVVSDLASLKSTVDNLKVGVTSVTVAGDQLVVVTDGATTKMNLPAGVQVSEIEIKDGHLYVGGVDKGAIDAPVAPAEKAQKVEVKDGYLYIDDVKQTLVDKVGSSVVIKDASNGVYTITIDGQTIQLPMADAFTSLTSVEFVKNAEDEDLTFGGIYQDGIITLGVEAIEWNKAAINHPDWKGPKGAVTRNQLLVGQTSAINVQVTPASYALGSQKLTLVDSKGNVAPAKISASENNLWYTTARANNTGSWNLAVEMDETITPDNIAKAFLTPDNDQILYALAVNGQVVTGYDIVVKTNRTATAATPGAGASTTLNGDTADLWYVDNNGVVKALSADKLPMGTTDLILWLTDSRTGKETDNNLVYDSYITFEGTNISLAAAKGIKANGMTITAPATAAGTTITATVNVMDITGYVWKKYVNISVATSAAQNLTISTTNYVVKPAATEDDLVSQSIKIDMENIFASIDAATLEQARLATQVAVKEAASQTGFFLNPSTSTPGAEEYFFDTPVYLKADNTTWDVRRDDLLELKYIKLNIGNTVANGEYKIAKDAKPGSYELAFVVLQDATNTTRDNEIIRIKMPVEVKTPAFTDMFDKNYTTDSFEARIQPVDVFTPSWTAPLTKYQARLSMTPAFKVQPAYSGNVDMLAFQFEKIGNDAAGNAIYPAVNLVTAYNSEKHDTSIEGFVDLNKKEIYNATGNDLSVTAISNTVAHYSVLDKLASARYAESITPADLADLKEAFMVSSAQFNTKIVKALDGLKLNSDANTVYTLGSNGIIKVGSDLLKLVWGSENKDIKLSGTDILFASTLGGYNFDTSVNFTTAGNRLKVLSKIEVTNQSAGSRATAAVTANGVQVSNLVAGETATVHFIFTDATGIQYKLSVRVKQG